MPRPMRRQASRSSSAVNVAACGRESPRLEPSPPVRQGSPLHRRASIPALPRRNRRLVIPPVFGSSSLPKLSRLSRRPSAVAYRCRADFRRVAASPSPGATRGGSAALALGLSLAGRPGRRQPGLCPRTARSTLAGLRRTSHPEALRRQHTPSQAPASRRHQGQDQPRQPEAASPRQRLRRREQADASDPAGRGGSELSRRFRRSCCGRR